MPIEAAIVEFAILPARIIACILEAYSLGLIPTGGLCGDVEFVGLGDTGSSDTTDIDVEVDINVYFHEETSTWYAVPRTNGQAVLRTLALLLLLIAVAGHGAIAKQWKITWSDDA